MEVEKKFAWEDNNDESSEESKNDEEPSDEDFLERAGTISSSSVERDRQERAEALWQKLSLRKGRFLAFKGCGPHFPKAQPAIVHPPTL